MIYKSHIVTKRAVAHRCRNERSDAFLTFIRYISIKTWCESSFNYITQINHYSALLLQHQFHIDSGPCLYLVPRPNKYALQYTEINIILICLGLCVVRAYHQLQGFVLHVRIHIIIVLFASNRENGNPSVNPSEFGYNKQTHEQNRQNVKIRVLSI